MTQKTDRKSFRTYALPFALVTSLFLLWGVANNMNDTLLAAFKRVMSISDLQTSFVQFAFYGSYFCFALPAALYIRKFSYKSGIMTGLALYALGAILFTPAGRMASYPAFLIAIYVMAGGCAILETTANPMIMSMGPAENATRRLNIAQAFNPIGAIMGILLSRYFILNELHRADAYERSRMSSDTLILMQRHELGAISETYMLIGITLLVLLVVIACMHMPTDRDTSRMEGSIGTIFRKLFRNKHYRNGVIAQFFYVGAQTCVWSFTIRLAMSELNIREAAASDYFLYSIIAFSLCRILFTMLMKHFPPVKLMAISAVGAIACTLAVIFCHGITAVVALVCISAFMSLMFPTIYGISLENIHGADAKIASSGLIMAIVGGALITPLQGLISDMSGSISTSFIVPLISFIIILTYSLGIIHGAKK